MRLWLFNKIDKSILTSKITAKAMRDNLIPELRLQRIAEIINKGIYLLALKEGWFVNCENKRQKTKPEIILSMEEEQVLRYCKNKGRVTNKDLQDLLGVHRNTSTKKLKSMVLKGILVQNGSRSHAYYVLNNT
jgi:predicted HTH transcriptional regulator